MVGTSQAHTSIPWPTLQRENHQTTRRVPCYVAVYTCIYVHVHIHFVDWVLVSVDLILNHRLCIYIQRVHVVLALIGAHELHG